MFKKQAGAGEAGFGFLEFGDVDGCDVETPCFYVGAGAREGSGENDGAAEGEGVGSVWLSGIHVDPAVGGKEVLQARAPALNETVYRVVASVQTSLLMTPGNS